jgi:hypothetical protein
MMRGLHYTAYQDKRERDTGRFDGTRPANETHEYHDHGRTTPSKMRSMLRFSEEILGYRISTSLLGLFFLRAGRMLVARSWG